MAGDKYYLRLKFIDLRFEGILFKSSSNGWKEVQEVDLIGRSLKNSSIFDSSACHFSD
jgi:hypothetical protein